MTQQEFIAELKNLKGADLVKLSAASGVSLPTMYIWRRSKNFSPNPIVLEKVVNTLKEIRNELSG